MWYGPPFWLTSIVPYWYLLYAALCFTLFVGCLLLFIGLYLYRSRKKQQKKTWLRALFSDLLAEMLLCQSEGERRDVLQGFLSEKQTLMHQPFVRKLLIRELVRTIDDISGEAAENLRWLYQQLNLNRDTLQGFASSQWHRKASAIQQLAQMGQGGELTRIYRETNNTNTLIRTEAQIAVVKLTGFKGLRFLNIVTHPVSEWQQLALISHLHEGEVEEEKILPWLCSKNESVVQFALRLVIMGKCYALHEPVAECLHHPSVAVRLQALRTLKEINNATTLPLFLTHFHHSSKEEQLAILVSLNELGASAGQLPFLTTLLQHADEAIRYRALTLIQQISPAWSGRVISQLKGNPSFTYILSSLQKQAV